MLSDRHFKYKNKLYSFYSIFHSAAAAAIIVSSRNIHIIEWDVFLLSLLRLASGMCVCVWLPWRSYAITFYVAAHCCRMSICAITAPAIFSVFAYISFLCECRIQFYIEINIRASNRVWARRNEFALLHVCGGAVCMQWRSARVKWYAMRQPVSYCRTHTQISVPFCFCQQIYNRFSSRI